MALDWDGDYDNSPGSLGAEPLRNSQADCAKPAAARPNVRRGLQIGYTNTRTGGDPVNPRHPGQK